MVYHRSALAVLVLSALAGCGEGTRQPDGNATATEPESPAQISATIPVKAAFTPGLWESVSTVTAASIPGAPAAVAQAAVGKTSTFRHCMTAAEADREPGEMFRKDAGDDCAYDRFTIGDGKIEAVLQCKGDDPDAALSTIEMTGTYDSASYAVHTRINAPGTDGQVITMEATSKGRRVGACS